MGANVDKYGYPIQAEIDSLKEICKISNLEPPSVLETIEGISQFGKATPTSQAQNAGSNSYYYFS